MNNCYSMNSNTLDLANKLVYYDTSVILELVGKSKDENRYKETVSFHTKLIEKGAISVSSIKVWEECLIVMPNSFARDRQKYDYENRKNILDRHPEIYSNSVQEVNKIRRILENQQGHVILDDVIDSALMAEATKCMQENKMQYPDSVHAVLARRNEVDFIATLDGDFKNMAQNWGIGVIMNSRHFFRRR